MPGKTVFSLFKEASKIIGLTEGETAARMNSRKHTHGNKSEVV